MCGTGFLPGSTEIALIFGRQRTLNETYVDKAVAALKAKHLNLKGWTAINQSGCT